MRFIQLLIALVWLLPAAVALAEQKLMETTGGDGLAEWEFIADGVMGGVSTGEAGFEDDSGSTYMRLVGEVSTENNGGFIQTRRLFPEAFPAEANGVTFEARGNGEVYYLFIRTKEMMRPWYYYSASFTPGSEWSAFDIPLSDFVASHAHLKAKIPPDEVISLGIVAYGRDHAADVSVKELSVY